MSLNTGLLTALGRIAALTRALGGGPLLNQVRNLIDMLCISLNKPLLRVEAGGFNLHGLLRHRSFLAAIAKRIYEPYLRELFIQSLKPGMVVVDGGAHIGLYTLISIRQLKGTGKIFAFEPDPFNFFALQYNVNRDRCSNVLTCAKALSNRFGSDIFWSSAGTIGGSLVRRQGIGPVQPLFVSVTTLDHEITDPVRSILVKLDVEGNEPAVLQGMSRLLQDAQLVVILVEINPSALKEKGWIPEDIVRPLQDQGLKIYIVDEYNRNCVPLKDCKALTKCNLYCVREI